MHQTHKIVFPRERDFSQLLSDTFNFIRYNFKELGKALLFIGGPILLLSGLVNGFYQTTMFNRTMEGFSSIMFPVFMLLTFIMQIVSYIVVMAATYEFIRLYIRGEQDSISVSDVWESVKSHFWMYFGTAFGYYFIVLLGFFALIIPGIYMSIAYMLVFIVRMNEGKSLSKALSRSSQLIKNYWWYTVGLSIIVMMILYGITMAFTIPNTIVTMIFTLHGLEQGMGLVMKGLFTFTSIIASFANIFQFVIYIALTFYYFSLVEKKEAAGLFQKIEGLSGEDSIPQTPGEALQEQ